MMMIIPSAFLFGAFAEGARRTDTFGSFAQ